MTDFTLRLNATSLLTKEVDGNQVIVGMRTGFQANSLQDSEFPFEIAGTVSLTSDEINEYSFNQLDEAVAKKISALFTNDPVV